MEAQHALTGTSTRPPSFPLRVSANHRYLEDQQGQPFLVHADVGWRICIRLTLEEAIAYLDDRKAKGFNALLVHAINKEKEGMTNRAGENPFTLIPAFLIFRYLGWVDSYKPLIVPLWFGGGAFSIFLLRQFISSIPLELDDEKS